MRVREAKDFLVQQIAEEASLEHVPLSEIEKRMLYFTEGNTAVEDPVALNDEFEAQCDTAKYEKKISHLMHQAYKKLRRDRSPALETWDQAIRRLKRGDHYLLVMWGQRPGIHGPQLLGAAIVALIFAAYAGMLWLTRHVAPPNPRVIQAIFLAIVIATIFFSTAIGKALGRILASFRGEDTEEE
jgi:hypothetical protein